MRSGLCLRIPGMQELSPTSNNLRVSSASSSFIKPASPKPSEIKTHHRTVTQSSAYHRIVSNTSIKKLSLPSFLTQSGNCKEEVLNKIPMGKTLPTQTSDLATDSSSVRTENAKENHCKKKLKDPEEFLKLIFKRKLSKEEILLKVGQYELTRGELQTLDPRSEISRSVIDACLRCIKHKNRKFFKNTEAHDRVFIVDTQMSQKIFTETKQKWPVFDRNLLKYE